VTLREYLNYKIRHSTISCWMMLPFGMLVVVTQAHGYMGATALVITTAFYAIALYYLFSARCPRCRTCLLWLLATFGVRLWIPPWFTYCPNCGLSFDTQLDSPPGPNQSLQLTADRRVTPLKFHEKFFGITKARYRQR
jgi:hypothetical protein